MNMLVEEHSPGGGSARRTNHTELLDLMLEFLSGNLPGRDTLGTELRFFYQERGLPMKPRSA